MSDKILVPLKKHDRIEQILPYIEKVAEPGARVVFLVRHPVGGFKWLQAYCGIAQSGLQKNLAVRRMMESYSLKMRTQLAERRVFQTCAALHALGLNISVDVYTNGLRNALGRHAAAGGVQLVIMQPKIVQRLMNFLQGAGSFRGMFSRSLSSFALFLHTAK
jgi:hypothetical protein